MAAQNDSTTTGRATPDPRVERSREVVLRSTLELLAEVGYGDLSIEGVAARSGVAKSTIYRHWPGKLALVTDAFHAMKVDREPPGPGPVRDRVVELLTELATGLVEPEWRAACLPALLEASAHCPEVAQVCSDLAELAVGRLAAVLDDAVAGGELPAATDTKLLADALTGPIILRGLFHRPRVTPAEVPALVDQLLPVSS
jgi:AcrR family transcriptional regulator